MKTVLVLALDGVMDSSLTITLDTLRTARTFLAQSGRPEALRILLAGHGKYVRTGGGMRVAADVRVADGPRADWIVVPGLGLVSDAEIDARLSRRDAQGAMRLLCGAGKGVRIGGSCSAVFLLARAGLLEGRHATMTWWLAHLFRARHPDVLLDESRMLVRDGPYLTAGSAFAQLDLVLAVVADVAGQRIADLCARYLLIDQRPSQARYMMASHVRHSDPTVVAAERWIDAHLREPISIAAMAAALAVSPKTLGRRVEAATGLTPLKLVQRRRLLQASHLLETTGLAVEEVAARVGYQDGTALRKLVKREFGMTPGALRAV